MHWQLVCESLKPRGPRSRKRWGFGLCNEECAAKETGPNRLNFRPYCNRVSVEVLELSSGGLAVPSHGSFGL